MAFRVNVSQEWKSPEEINSLRALQFDNYEEDNYLGSSPESDSSKEAFYDELNEMAAQMELGLHDYGQDNFYPDEAIENLDYYNGQKEEDVLCEFCENRYISGSLAYCPPTTIKHQKTGKTYEVCSFCVTLYCHSVRAKYEIVNKIIVQ